MGDDMGSEMVTGHAVSDQVVEATKHVITVGQLREQLLQFDQSAPVVLVKDSEGNGFSGLSGIGWGWYDPEQDEQIGSAENYADSDDPGYDPADDPDVLPVVFLDPVN